MNFPPELTHSLDFDELMTVLCVATLEKLDAPLPCVHEMRDQPDHWILIELMGAVAAATGVDEECFYRHAADYLKKKGDT